MNKKALKIGVTGKILKGDHAGWFVFIEDDFKNSGGYLILIFNHHDKHQSTEGFDYWAEDKNSLDEIYKEADWEIQWSDENYLG
ncbi:MAG: hypothetical protein KGJ02_08525 [Verrucomicrobiota bacterium]|nr:hypothetical protein [Verrucomicrobiota bacterium]